MKAQHLQVTLATLLVMIVLIPGIAGAQDEEGFGLEEVTVTARRVEESLQRTPVAVSAFTGAEIELRGDLDIIDIGAATPNVQIGGSAGLSGMSGAPTIFVRGIGQADFIIVTDPAVGVYIDDVYMGRSIGSLFDLVDLERVEVLRGPQGTLFGRNTIGGAISLTTRKPHNEFGGKIAGTIGGDEHYEVQAAINMPVTEKLAMRFSTMYRKRDGYVKALQYDDLKLGDDNVFAVRGQLRFEPTDSVTFDLSADYSREREAPAPAVPLNIGTLGVPTDSGDAYGRGGSSIYNNGPPIPGLTPNPAECRVHDPDLNIPAPLLPECHGNFWLPDDKYAVNTVWFDSEGNPVVPETELDVWGVAGTFTWDSRFGTFKSITAWREFDSTFTNKQDFVPFIVFQNTHDHTDSGFTNKQFSQEFQYINSVFDNALDLTLGAYYFNEDGFEDVRLLASHAYLFNFLGGIGAPVPPVASPPIFFTNTRDMENTSYAVYGQATWHITDRSHLTGGFRYTEDEKFLDTANIFIGPQGEIIDESGGTLNFEELTGMLTFGYDISDSVFAYGSWSEGFRDGGFPGRFLTPQFPNPLPGFDPEYVTAYELGIKADLFDDRLRANLAWFLTDYSDMQITATPIGADPGSVGISVDNLGDATIWGIEAELTAIITDNFRIDYSLGYMDAEFDCIVEVDTAANPIGCTETALVNSAGFDVGVDNDLPFTPEWTWNLGATYMSPMPGLDGNLTWRLNWRYVDDQFYDVTNIPLSHEDSYSVVNAGVTYEPPDGRWSVTLGGRNLTDNVYYTTRGLGANLATANGAIARPRTIYATVRYNFGGE